MIGATPPKPQVDLGRVFLARDPSFAWKWAEKGRRIELTSQTWQGQSWRHEILLDRPKEPKTPGTALLWITGDQAARDLSFGKELARETGMTVATLFDVPNQPLWDMREDDLIAHSFQKYLETGDPEWPLLVPMVRSALRAMDAVQRADPTVRRFVVSGASKRGWTTWLVGSLGQPRVIAIAPLLFDSLRLPRQLAKQQRDWGHFSPMISDYTSRGLQELVESPEAKSLLEIVDPYERRGSLRLPKLLIHGANDPYWTVDAHSLYIDDLPGDATLLEMPNVGHDVEPISAWAPSVAALARTAALEKRLPNPERAFEWDQARWSAPRGSGAKRARLFRALSSNREFAESRWVPVVSCVPGESGGVPPVESGFVAEFAQVEYRLGDLDYNLTTRVRVWRAGQDR